FKDVASVQVFKRHARAVGLNLRLAVELDAGILHPAILAHAVLARDPEKRLRSSLLADQRPVFICGGQTEGNRHHLIVRQPERHVERSLAAQAVPRPWIKRLPATLAKTRRSLTYSPETSLPGERESPGSPTVEQVSRPDAASTLADAGRSSKT